MEELEKLHGCQELAIMDLFHNVEKVSEKIEDSCTFTERVLKNGNGLQLMLLKKMIKSQLLYLINNTPKPDVNINIEFYTDTNVFQNAVEKSFGSFHKETIKVNKRFKTPFTLQNKHFRVFPRLSNFCRSPCEILRFVKIRGGI